MNTRIRCSVVFVWLALLPAVSLQAAEVRDELAQIVRLMGYGGGIHNFKNYVLRGREKYRTAAHADFTAIFDVIANLERSDKLNAAEQKALEDVKAVVEAYDRTLGWIADLLDKGWRIEDIDRVVIIDDTAAVKGLDTLRARWKWTDLEEIEFQFGYGKGIHNFKNYVLRGRENYHTEALQNLLAVDALVADLLDQPEMKDPQAAAQKLASIQGTPVHDRAVREITYLFRDSRAALVDVGRTARAYRDHLELIERLITMQRSVRQIDLAVKINDGPATAGLAHLRTGLAFISEQRAGATAQSSKP